MKLRDDDQKWISSEIARQIEGAMVELGDTLKPRGLKKAAFWLRQLGPISATIAIVVTLLGLAGSGWNYAFTRIEKQATFQTKTEGRLDAIEKEVKEIHSDMTRQSLAIHASLPLQTFRSTVPEVAAAVALAKEQKIDIPKGIIDNLSQKLADTDKTAPSFWQAAALVITFRSSSAVGGLQNWSQVFPPCRGPVDMLGADRNATAQPTTKEGKPVGPKVHITRVGTTDCYAEIDGKTISKWDCTRCLIKYSGGPVSMTDVTFTDCLFVLSLPEGNPPCPRWSASQRNVTGGFLTGKRIHSVSLEFRCLRRPAVIPAFEDQPQRFLLL